MSLRAGATIGLLGGGQLGRMLAGAAARLGFDVAVYAPETDSPAARVASWAITAPWTDVSALGEFARRCDVVTLEFENVPASAAKAVEDTGTPLRPGPRALEVAQDRVAEKAFLASLGIPVTPWHPVDTADAAVSALANLDAPALLKTRRDGYDGKGQIRLAPGEDAAAAFARLGGVPCILERMAAFDCEISALVARAPTGDMVTWAPSLNQHEGGILRRSRVPSGCSQAVCDTASVAARRLAEALDYVGVLALELFVLPDGRLLANEFAPRVHNSGHWTPEACVTGQFENHIRAVAGWPLGETRLLHAAEMENLIGDEWADTVPPGPGVSLTLYGKRESRPGRKMGHLVRRTGQALG